MPGTLTPGAQLLLHELGHLCGAYIAQGIRYGTVALQDLYAFASWEIPLRDMHPETALTAILSGPLTSCALDGTIGQAQCNADLLRLFSAHPTARADIVEDGEQLASDLVLAAGALERIGKRNKAAIDAALSRAHLVAQVLSNHAQAAPELYRILTDRLEQAEQVQDLGSNSAGLRFDISQIWQCAVTCGQLPFPAVQRVIVSQVN